MGTGTCLRGRKWCAYTSMTAPMGMARAGMLSAPSRRTWASPAQRSSALSAIWSDSAGWKYSLVTGRTAARPPICTDYGNESRRKNSLPAKGRLRQLTRPGVGSLRPTQKVPIEEHLPSEERSKVAYLRILLILRIEVAGFPESRRQAWHLQPMYLAVAHYQILCLIKYYILAKLLAFTSKKFIALLFSLKISCLTSTY